MKVNVDTAHADCFRKQWILIICMHDKDTYMYQKLTGAPYGWLHTHALSNEMIEKDSLGNSQVRLGAYSPSSWR